MLWTGTPTSIPGWSSVSVPTRPRFLQGLHLNVDASLVFNSDAVDTSAGGSVPDGIQVAFGATLGGVSPIADQTVDGGASTVFTAGLVLGTAQVSATADNATVNTPIEIVDVPVELMAFSVE